MLSMIQFSSMLVATLSGPGLGAAQSLPRTYDAVFQRYRGAIPMEYLGSIPPGPPGGYSR